MIIIMMLLLEIHQTMRLFEILKKEVILRELILQELVLQEKALQKVIGLQYEVILH